MTVPDDFIAIYNQILTIRDVIYSGTGVGATIIFGVAAKKISENLEKSGNPNLQEMQKHQKLVAKAYLVGFFLFLGYLIGKIISGSISIYINTLESVNRSLAIDYFDPALDFFSIMNLCIMLGMVAFITLVNAGSRRSWKALDPIMSSMITRPKKKHVMNALITGTKMTYITGLLFCFYMIYFAFISMLRSLSPEFSQAYIDFITGPNHSQIVFFEAIMGLIGGFSLGVLSLGGSMSQMNGFFRIGKIFANDIYQPNLPSQGNRAPLPTPPAHKSSSYYRQPKKSKFKQQSQQTQPPITLQNTTQAPNKPIPRPPLEPVSSNPISPSPGTIITTSQSIGPTNFDRSPDIEPVMLTEEEKKQPAPKKKKKSNESYTAISSENEAINQDQEDVMLDFITPVVDPKDEVQEDDEKPEFCAWCGTRMEERTCRLCKAYWCDYCHVFNLDTAPECKVCAKPKPLLGK